MSAGQTYGVSQRWICISGMVLVLLLLACGPLAGLSQGGGGGTYHPAPIIFDDLPPTDPRAIAVNYAIAQKGKPYSQWPYGEVTCGRQCHRTGPNCYDCSGLTQTSYRQANITIGPTTFYQIDDGVSVPCTAADLNGPATSCWAPGDLALFCDAGGPYHVAMYAYDGWFIESFNCARGVIFWERTRASMANLCSVRRIVRPDGQPYVVHAPLSPPIVALLGDAP